MPSRRKQNETPVEESATSTPVECETTTINISGDGVKAIRNAARVLRIKTEDVVRVLLHLSLAQSRAEPGYFAVKSQSTTGHPHAIYTEDLPLLEDLGRRHGGPGVAVLSAFAQTHGAWLTYATSMRPLSSMLHFKPPVRA